MGNILFLILGIVYISLLSHEWIVAPLRPLQKEFPPGLSMKLGNLRVNVSFFIDLVSDYVACTSFS